LLQNSDTVVLKDELMKSVWPGHRRRESNLAQNIFVLRKTPGEASGDSRYIVTVPVEAAGSAKTFDLFRSTRTDQVLQSHSITRAAIDG
jgi:Transcriptional regulatory protein, C terminal